MNFNLNFTFYIKTNSKWIIDLSIKYKTIKLAEKIENLNHLGVGKESLEVTSKA